MAQKKDDSIGTLTNENKSKTQFRKNMVFEQSEDGARVISFLDLCARKQGILATYALLEFIEKYGLENKTSKEIVAFANSYKFITSALAQNNINLAFTAPAYPNAEQYSMPVQNKPSIEPTQQDIIDAEKAAAEAEAAENEDVKQQTNELLAAFGF